MLRLLDRLIYIKLFYINRQSALQYRPSFTIHNHNHTVMVAELPSIQWPPHQGQVGVQCLAHGHFNTGWTNWTDGRPTLPPEPKQSHKSLHSVSLWTPFFQKSFPCLNFSTWLTSFSYSSKIWVTPCALNGSSWSLCFFAYLLRFFFKFVTRL